MRISHALKVLSLVFLIACVCACSSEVDTPTRAADTRPTGANARAAPSPSVHASTRPAPAPTPEPAKAEEADASRAAKRYLEMTDAERDEFVERRARHVSRMISSGTYEFTGDALRYIKQYVDAYARRVGTRARATWGEDLNFVFARAQKHAPTIIRSFNSRRVPPAIGLYIVFVETEYTNFRQENRAGAAGLFQFIGPTAELYGVPRGERTNVEKMAPAAAHYIADRITEFGTDPMSIALAIAGYNRSPDSVRNDLGNVLNSANKERSFWTLVANSDKLDHWFRGENVKYVPKFFAAAIVGETPWAFGLEMRQALSTWTAPAASIETGAARRPRRVN